MVQRVRLWISVQKDWSWSSSTAKLLLLQPWKRSLTISALGLLYYGWFCTMTPTSYQDMWEKKNCAVMCMWWINGFGSDCRGIFRRLDSLNLLHLNPGKLEGLILGTTTKKKQYNKRICDFFIFLVERLCLFGPWKINNVFNFFNLRQTSGI